MVHSRENAKIYGLDAATSPPPLPPYRPPSVPPTVVDNSTPRPTILDMVEARWPVGWSACAIACVSVVLVQRRCGWNKITHAAQYEEIPVDVQERLQKIRSRGDIDLCIEEVRRDE